MAFPPSSVARDEAPPNVAPNPPPPRRRRWYAPVAAVALVVAALLTARIHWGISVLLLWIFTPVILGLRSWWVRGERSRGPTE